MTETARFWGHTVLTYIEIEMASVDKTTKIVRYRQVSVWDSLSTSPLWVVEIVDF